MTWDEDDRYDELVELASRRNLRTGEEMELRNLSFKRMEEIKERNRPLYEWDYPIKKKE